MKHLLTVIAILAFACCTTEAEHNCMSYLSTIRKDITFEAKK